MRKEKKVKHLVMLMQIIFILRVVIINVNHLEIDYIREKWFWIVHVGLINQTGTRSQLLNQFMEVVVEPSIFSLHMFVGLAKGNAGKCLYSASICSTLWLSLNDSCFPFLVSLSAMIVKYWQFTVCFCIVTSDLVSIYYLEGLVKL